MVQCAFNLSHTASASVSIFSTYEINCQLKSGGGGVFASCFVPPPRRCCRLIAEALPF